MNILFNLIDTLLKIIYGLTGDWGLAILFITLGIKIILMPLSIKSKISMEKSMKFSKEIEKTREKYKNNKYKLKQEINKIYNENNRASFGFLINIMQIPIIFSLYKVIIKLPVYAKTILVPWVSNIKLSDPYFIIPTLYTITLLLPSLISHVPYFKTEMKLGISKANIVASIVMGLIFTIKLPVAVGIYFIASAAYSFMEEIIYILLKKKKLIIVN